MARFPGVHTICGLTNVSHGLPARKLINRTFLVGAIAAAWTRRSSIPPIRNSWRRCYAARAVFGRDDYCINLIEAFQRGQARLTAPRAPTSPRRPPCPRVSRSPAMPRVTFHPDSRSVEVAAGERLLAAAWKAGVGIKSVCGGHGKCGSCLVEVEQRRRTRPRCRRCPRRSANCCRRRPRRRGYRLACMCEVHGEVSRVGAAGKPGGDAMRRASHTRSPEVALAADGDARVRAGARAPTTSRCARSPSASRAALGARSAARRSTLPLAAHGRVFAPAPISMPRATSRRPCTPSATCSRCGRTRHGALRRGDRHRHDLDGACSCAISSSGRDRRDAHRRAIRRRSTART